MSLNPTKSITNVGNVANRELPNTLQKNQPPVTKTPKAPSVSTSVSLSPAASTLLSLQDNDIDMEKVERIKQAISSGELAVDTQKIADSLIQETAQDLAK